MKQIAEAIAIIGIVFCIGRCSNESKRLEMEHEQMWLDRGYRENHGFRAGPNNRRNFAHR